MRVEYGEIPHRLQEYRKYMSKNQEEMGELLCVSQSHYCRLESGRNILSFEIIRTFWAKGGDIFWLITGERYRRGILDEYMEKCKSPDDRPEVLRLLIWVTRQGLRKARIQVPGELRNMWKYVILAENQYREDNIWINIRRAEKLSQKLMADKIEIDVKRYRRLERLELQPDAYILMTLYRRLSYSPLLFLENELYFPDVINRIWEEFPGEIQEPCIRMLDEGMDFLEKDR